MRTTHPTLVISTVTWVFAAMLTFAWLTFACTVAIADGPSITIAPQASSSAERNPVETQNDGAKVNVAATTSTIDPTTDIDQTTKPFEFRCTNPQWPITPAGDTNGLSVGIQGQTQWKGRDLVLKYRLVRVQDGALVGREQTDIQLDDSGHHSPIYITASAPAKPGVYEIRCQLVEKSNRLWSRLTGGESELASVRTPWMVYQADRREPSDVYHLSNRMIWNSVGHLQPLESNAWETPDWIPNSATKIVPNVKRVGETLTPWRDESETQPIALSPGQAIVGVISELQASAPHQMAITVAAPSGSSKSSLLSIEIASDASFNTVDQSQQIQNTSPLDISSENLNASQRHDILVFPSKPHQFVRITNQSSEQDLVIESAEMFRGTKNPQQTAEGAFSRGLTVNVDVPAWVTSLTPDLGNAATRQNYDARTWKLHQVATAINRLPVHADWLGYDSIILPLPTGNEQDSDSDPALTTQSTAERATLQSDWLNRSLEFAAQRWAESSELEIRFRTQPDVSPTPSNTVASTAPSSTLDLTSTVSNRWIIKQLLQSLEQRISFTTSQLNTTLPHSLRESIHQYRLAPNRLTVVGIGDDRATRYFRVLVDETNAGLSQPNPLSASSSVVITNSAPWTCEVELDFDPNSVQNCELRGTGQSGSKLRYSNTPGRYRVRLPPISIANISVETNRRQCEIRSWRCSMAGGESTLNRLKEYVGDIVAKLGTLADPPKCKHLRNGDFEVAGQVGIVGWMHTQFPDTAVMIDPNESITGKHSVRLNTDIQSAGRTWLVSETIPAPPSGRLAVSLATRAGIMRRSNEPKDRNDQSTAGTETIPSHRMRVALEGNRDGVPVRIAREFDIPKDGQWQKRRIVLEANLGSAQDLDSLRLTIDSLSPGKLWVDDIALHDHFPTQAERTAMQGNAFLAIQGLQRGELTPAAGLLHNPWARYLLLNSRDVLRNGAPSSPEDPSNQNTDQGDDVTLIVGAQRPAATNVPQARNATEKTQPSRPRETVAERLKDWLPKPIRF